ncbi:MAG: ATP-binding region ATPase domain protein [Gemmatimonadetes bacterium]|nr:ATP-binding region ATPase domain protein [Gemmatimonadota bacterium]
MSLLPADSLVALLVEDNAADAELIAMRLETAAARTRESPVFLLHADNVADACSILSGVAVDVVILDLSLPDAHWLGALDRVRGAAPDPPIIVLTGLADEALALRALRAGAQDYLVKPPPSGPTLLRILRYARERQQLSRRLAAATRASDDVAQRWRVLADSSRLLAASHNLSAGLAEVARLVVPSAADGFVVDIAEDEHLPAVFHFAHVEEGEVGRIRPRLTRAVLDQAADDHGALAEALELASVVPTPLVAGDRTRGVLILAFSIARMNGPADREFARSLADRVGLAIEATLALQETLRSVEARDRALGVVSHDLGNPLGAILVCAAALLEPEPPSQEGVRGMAQIIERSARWMQHIVYDLVDRASLDAGHLALHRRTFLAHDVLPPLRVVFEPLAKERGIELAFDESAAFAAIDADPHRLAQVLANLLSNALKFTPNGGMVRLSIAGGRKTAADSAPASERSVVRFSVRDTGSGIAVDDLPHLFDWFWRSAHQSGRGAGLGLAIAKGLVEAHQSRLHVDSAPGAGSTFWFELPVVDHAPIAGGSPTVGDEHWQLMA